MPSNKKNPSAIVIGAGMTGIQAVIKLKQAGINDVTLLEKKDKVGGTWRENTYPGVACDVPAHAYTYSFAPNPEWSGMFAPGAEIQKYFEKVFYDFGVDQHTRFNEGVTSAIYNDGQWTVTTSQGNTLICDILIAATGMLHKPVTPEFKGLSDFKGEVMHSAEWNPNIDLSGKKIGVIGTGSSAAQLIPELINRGDTLVTVFQRTPQYLVKVENKLYSEKKKQKFRDNPKAIQRAKDMALMVFEKGTTALTSDKPFDKVMHKLMAWNSTHYLKSAVKDPELRAKLTPDYKFGCKRVVMNASFYPAIQKDNAHLVTDGITQFEATGIRTADGQLHELDIVVCATGFDPVAYMRPMEFKGRGGADINQKWAVKPRAYRSMMVPEFPNFFLLLGPNSPIGNYSVIAMSEKQTEYALEIVKAWRNDEIETIEATENALKDWNAMLKSKMGTTVWASGCSSWYLDADGDPLTWPDTWKAWCAAMDKPDFSHFHKTEPKPEAKPIIGELEEMA